MRLKCRLDAPGEDIGKELRVSRNHSLLSPRRQQLGRDPVVLLDRLASIRFASNHIQDIFPPNGVLARSGSFGSGQFRQLVETETRQVGLQRLGQASKNRRIRLGRSIVFHTPRQTSERPPWEVTIGQEGEAQGWELVRWETSP